MDSTAPTSTDHDDIGVTWDDPTHERLTWDRDDMHMPFALTPLAADFVRLMGAGMNGRYDALGGFPQRWRTGVWSGYAYFAFDLDPALQADVDRRWVDVQATQQATVARWWKDEALPELMAIYQRIAAVDVDGTPGPDLAVDWSAAWASAERAWTLHFISIIGPYQALKELTGLVERLLPEFPGRDAASLTQGRCAELHAVDLAIEELVELAESAPAVRASLGDASGADPLELADVDGGPQFVARLKAFLAEHGHLGQAFDDLRLPSWSDEPRLLLAEVAKRIERAHEPAAVRRARLQADADAVAERIRAALADRPDALAAFEQALDVARSIGPLTEGHNYWIDRMIQARLRTLSIRFGRRLVRDGVIEDPEDVFFLDVREVGDAVAQPVDLRGLVADRRAEHERWTTLRPPAVVGTASTEPPTGDQFDGPRFESDDPMVLRGTGASSGIARGVARVALSPEDFSRIRPGDIIVCPSSNPSWVPVFGIAGGLVTNTGGLVSHAAVVAREFGLPAVVGTGDATTRITDGSQVEIDGSAGTVRLL